MESSSELLESKEQIVKPSLFPEQLRHERKLRGWSQAELAEQLGNDAKSIGRWERGENFPTPYYRYKLLALFEKNAEELGLIESDLGENREEHSSESFPQNYSPPLASPDAISQVKRELERLEVDNQAKTQKINQAEQEAEQGYQVILIEREKRFLEIERERIELLEKRLEVQKKGVEYAIEVAKKVIDTLQPNANEETRAMLVKTLLPNFLQFLAGKELELTLPESQESEKKSNERK